MNPDEAQDDWDRALSIAAMALEHAFGVPYHALAMKALGPTGPGLQELALMGAQLFVDTVEVARGNLSSVHLPRRLPRRGETPGDSWVLLLSLVKCIPPLRSEWQPPTPRVDCAALRAAVWGPGW